MTATKIRPVQATAPERIYLQGGPQLPPETEFGALSEVTWCRDDVDGAGIPYVRADLAGEAPAAVAGPAPAGWRLVPATPTRDWIAAVADGGYEDCDCASLIADILSRAPAAPALEAPAAPVPAIEGLLDDDGENQAVRSFLLLYGQPGLTVARMREHMDLSGWGSAPVWTGLPESQGHLTKAGAQSWLRHLFTLEAPAAPAVPAGFALVPIEPTQQMLDAGRWSGAGSVSIQEEWARKEVWSRMLATVTPPPAAYADDLVALVTELVQALRKATPDNDLAGHALDYLKRNGLQESPLRAADTAPQAPAAPWKDHQTARLVNDLRDCAIKYHGAGQLRERIAHIVVPLCDQLKGALAAPAAPAVDAETIEDAERFRAMAKAALTDDEVFERALDQHPDMGGDATIDDVRAMFDAAIAAQAAAKGEHDHG